MQNRCLNNVRFVSGQVLAVKFCEALLTVLVETLVHVTSNPLLQVRYLKIIEKSGYQALPWVRYITQNGDYQLRTQ